MWCEECFEINETNPGGECEICLDNRLYEYDEYADE